jgi:hypothetical protein
MVMFVSLEYITMVLVVYSLLVAVQVLATAFLEAAKGAMARGLVVASGQTIHDCRPHAYMR